MATIKPVLPLLFATLIAVSQAETKAVIETNMGNITLSLDEKKAPITVANFVRYAETGFYNHTLFHRVIDQFMIQGGGFTSHFIPKQTNQPIKNEANNGLKNTTGTIAMARTHDPHSASSQFFINLTNNTFLDHQNTTPEQYGYAVFGHVIEGMEVVNKIAQVRTTYKQGHTNVPLQPIIIRTIRIQK